MKLMFVEYREIKRIDQVNLIVNFEHFNIGFISLTIETVSARIVRRCSMKLEEFNCSGSYEDLIVDCLN